MSMRRESQESLIRRLQADGCPDSVLGAHGPTDGRGRCPWCRRKVEAAMPRPPATQRPEIDDAYDQFYDPGYGGAR